MNTLRGNNNNTNKTQLSLETTLWNRYNPIASTPLIKSNMQACEFLIGTLFYKGSSFLKPNHSGNNWHMFLFKCCFFIDFRDFFVFCLQIKEDYDNVTRRVTWVSSEVHLMFQLRHHCYVTNQQESNRLDLR